MQKRTVRKGMRYRAAMRLGFLEKLASNELIAKKFEDLGFEDVKVTGKGASRTAEALWPLPDADGEMPSQIVELIEL
jgi:transketolase N-terminal domain/subunit